MSNIGHNGPERGSGWFALSRELIDHPVVGFGNPVKPADPRQGAYSRAEAWIWMIANASYHERTFMNKGRLQTLLPGQIVGGRKFLAETWNWTEQTVREFLKRLRLEMMITLETDVIRSSKTTSRPGADQNQTRTTNRNHQRTNTANVITLCNYINYQLTLDEEQPPQQPANNQQTTTEQPPNNQNLTKKQIHTHGGTRARTREAGPNEEEVSHGVIFNCETVRHRDGHFALSIPGIELRTHGTVPRESIEKTVKGYALQWGLQIENGEDPRKVVPNDAMAYLSAQVNKDFRRPIEAEFKGKRAETAAQRKNAEYHSKLKEMLEEERNKLGGK